MFSPGDLLYITPFYFKNGNTSKNKYFIILGRIEHSLIIASLPTRSCKAPSLITQTHGCNNDNERMFNCYAYEPDRPITETGFSFPLATYVYGNEVEDYEISNLENFYKVEGVDFDHLGCLLEKEFTNLIECLKMSTAVKRKIKRLL